MYIYKVNVDTKLRLIDEEVDERYFVVAANSYAEMIALIEKYIQVGIIVDCQIISVSTAPTIITVKNRSSQR